MAYFDIAANSITAQPVTAYVQGRAMRMAYEGEKQNQLFQQMQMQDWQKQRDFDRQAKATELEQSQQKFEAEQQMARAESAMSAFGSVRDAPDKVAALGAFRMSQGLPDDGERDPVQIEAAANAQMMKLAGMYGVKVPEKKITNESGDIAEYKLAKSEGYTGNFNQFLTESANRKRQPATSINIGGQGPAPAGYAWNPDGSQRKILGGPADKPKKLTEGERLNQSFTTVMINAEKNISAVKYKPTNADLVAFETILSKNTGGISKGVANLTLGKEAQLAMQSAMEWLDPLVRSRTGATVNESEFQTLYRTYFPVAADDQDLIDRKKMSRDVATRSINQKAGLGAVDMDTPTADGNEVVLPNGVKVTFGPAQ